MNQINLNHFQKIIKKNYIDDPDDPYICWKCGSDDLILTFLPGGNIFVSKDECIDITNINISIHGTRLMFDCNNCNCKVGWSDINFPGTDDVLLGVWCDKQSKHYRTRNR